jgi:hypothetical protein
MFRLILIVVLISSQFLIINNVIAATFVVNTNIDDLSDINPSNGICEMTNGLGDCSLRAAIESANESAGGPHVVEIPYLEGESYPIWAQTGLQPNVPMTIRGTGDAPAVIVGGLFLEGGMISVGDSVTLENLELRPNTTSEISTYGLAVYSSNLVTLNDITIIPGDNGYNLGLLVSGGLVFCNRCVIRDGQSLGVRVVNNGDLTLLNSRISNNTNSIGNQGAGIRLDSGEVTLRDSLVDNNKALGNSPSFGSGGGIYTADDTFLHVINSTISQNKANRDGGGIFAQDEVLLENVTITQNRANYDNSDGGTGGGIYINDFSVVTSKNSIIHGNFLSCPPSFPLCFPEGRNCDDTQGGTLGIESLGWTMVGDDAHCPITNLTGESNYTSSVVPHLGPLTLLGGLHPVHPISQAGVEADGGDPDGCTFKLITSNGSTNLALTSDQRGMPRPLDSDPNVFDGVSCDIGAYEAKCFGDDPDGDFVGSQCDICPNVFDPLQEDSDDDGEGDACKTYTLGGTLMGLAQGNSVEITNGQDSMQLIADGVFSFANTLITGENYSVEISQQPTSPNQNCIVQNGEGMINNGDVDNIIIDCDSNDEIFSSSFE